MCGIVGVVCKDPKQTVHTARLEAARDTLAHRGPDDAGLWHRPGVALGHRRLAILDLSNEPGHGQQPFADAANTKALTYNGEVYNYRELMARYEQQGHTFQSTCDTELVFHALATDGPAALEQFHGMFALAFYDAAKRKLLLVRDRLGQKPLYYHDAGDALVFASELKAILAYTGQRYALDPAALEHFFTRGYVPAPRTIFQGIHKLPAGCRLTLDANAWTHEVEQWWDATPQDLEARYGPLTDEGVVDTLDELLTQSVSDRLISDVPIGTLLSGGIDSSLITAMASKTLKKQGKGRVSAFTIGFDESEQHNEMPYAELVAKQFGCDWHPRKLNQGNQDWLRELDDASRFYDEPFGNFTVTSQRTLSTLCREELTVVLTGQGGDELTAGYPGRYNWVAQTEQQAANKQTRSQYAPAVDDVLHHLNKSSFVTWPGALSQMLADTAKHAMINAADPDDTITPFWLRHAWPDRLGNVLYTDAKTNLPDYLVCIEERASMSASLEARNPMLDHRVVEFLLSLPMRYKVRPGNGPMAVNGLQNKWILHALAKRYLPAEAFDRPKRGFTPPIQQWMQRYAPRIAEVFRETQALTAGLYSPSWQSFLNAGQYTPQAMMPVYYCLVFALWARRYQDHIRPFTEDNAPAPSRAMSEANPRITPRSQDGSAHTAFREQSPVALATARWFCQMLGNLPDAGTLHITGDPTGFYADLATRSGYRVVAGVERSDPPECTAGVQTPSPRSGGGCADPGHQPHAHALVGLDAVTAYTTQPRDDNTMLLAFIPFDTHEQQQVQQALQQLNTHRPIQGHQAVPVGEGKAVLIARCAAAHLTSQA
ncbi:MAG: asparagine synthase (glutamine-hydrolyzing) [Planctomycetota bacterium]